MALRRLLPSAIIAFGSANIVAGTLIYLGIFSPQMANQVVDGNVADAVRDIGSLDGAGWMTLAQGAAVTSAMLAALTLIPVVIFMTLAWRYHWRDLRAIVLTGACIGPLFLATALLALSSNFSRSLGNPAFLTFYLVLAAAGAFASLIFWLIVKPSLPWLGHAGRAGSMQPRS